MPVLRDEDAKVAEGQLKVSMLPTAYLLDRQGRIRFVHEGVDEGHLQRTTAHLEALLAESP